MVITVGITGKPNCGKSTFFKAATLMDVEIANYPFTTIGPNHGMGFVTAECPCRSLGVENSCTNCNDGKRLIPIKLIDVAGLVPGAHKGRGLGNAFLDNLRQASAYIHIIDASGSTDIEGNNIGVGEHDPAEDVEFLEEELTMWIFSILKRNWDKLARRIEMKTESLEDGLTNQLAGAGVELKHVKHALDHLKENKAASLWTDETLYELSEYLKEDSKPRVIASNKIDLATDTQIQMIDSKYKTLPTSGAAELALRLAAKGGFIDYTPGDPDFKVGSKLSEGQKKGLESITELLSKYGSTGVQACLNYTVFDLLDQIVAYPVEDENKYTDSKDNVLPDAILMKKGSTTRELAYKVHTEIGDKYAFSIDARTHMRLKEDHALEDRAVIRIVLSS